MIFKIYIHKIFALSFGVIFINPSLAYVQAAPSHSIFESIFGFTPVVLLTALIVFIFSYLPMKQVEGKVSRIQGDVNRKNRFEVNGEAAYINFNDHVKIKNDENIKFCASKKSDVLKVLAYRNLTNGNFGENGTFYRRVGWIFFACSFLTLQMVVPTAGVLMPSHLILTVLAIAFLAVGYRSKRALKRCFKETSNNSAKRLSEKKN